MDDSDELWQQRISELYRNVDELYEHVDVTTVVFDRALQPDVEVAELLPALRDVANEVLTTGKTLHNVPLDSTGRRRAHGHLLRQGDVILGVACVVEDDSARRELFVRCALAIFDGYRRNEAALLQRARDAADEARNANRLRDQFMATIAHELRGPVSTILLWEQILRVDGLDANTRTQALDSIRGSATSQTLLLADLLDVSRAINGKLRVDARPLSIERVLSASIDDARPAAAGRNLRIDAFFEAELGQVLGDAHRLRQVFDNLLSNAIKWTETGGITVRARTRETSVEVEVADTGHGIAADFLPYVFDPFSQDAESGGLGLGLAIARQLVDVHGGSLTAASAGLGHGATFTVTLPCVSTLIRPNDALSQPPPEALLSNVHVLAVDDDPNVVGALGILLRRAGATVTSAASAADAYVILLRGTVDVVLSDISMPGEDGFAFLRRIRSTPVMASIPVIAVSANVGLEHRERALDAGFDRYVEKPINVDELITSIAHVARRRRSG